MLYEMPIYVNQPVRCQAIICTNLALLLKGGILTRIAIIHLQENAMFFANELSLPPCVS